MKKYWCILLMMLCVAIFPSCNNSDNEDPSETYKEWREQNEKFMEDNVYYNTDYSRIQSQSKMGYIYYKVIKTGEDTEPILYTSTVKVGYEGKLINGTIFDTNIAPYGKPVDFVVNGVVDGFATALQNMHVGDRWEVWMPWQLGYGASGNREGAIAPYTALFFTIEVVEIVKK